MQWSEEATEEIVKMGENGGAGGGGGGKPETIVRLMYSTYYTEDVWSCHAKVLFMEKKLRFNLINLHVEKGETGETLILLSI